MATEQRIKIHENEVIEDIPFPEVLNLDNVEDGINYSKVLTTAVIDGSVQQIFYQATAPTSGMHTNDYWIDSDDNKIYRYLGTAWAEVQDDDIATAINNAATAQSTADGKIYIFRQTTAPVATDAPSGALTTGDLWFDTDDKNKAYRYSGSAWVDARDTDIAQAIADAATAQATADGKVTTFIQTTAPTAEGTGDLWLDSDDGYRVYRW